MKNVSPTQLSIENDFGKKEKNYLNLEVEKIGFSRSRLSLCSEILQSIGRSDASVEEIFGAIATKLLGFLKVAHVAIYKLDNLDNLAIDINESVNITDKITGQIVAEAIAPNCEHFPEISIENILSEEYQWVQSVAGEISDRDKSLLSKSEINLAEIFAQKSYLLVPIFLSNILREDDRAQDLSLWGFLSVHLSIEPSKELDSETFQSYWNLDDVLMLQQIAMQIEFVLQKEAQLKSLTERLQNADRAYSKLHYSSEQYLSLIEKLPNVSYVSPIASTLEFAYTSPQLQKLLGVPDSEMSIDFVYMWSKYLHSDDRDRVQQELQTVIETESAFSCEYRMITHDKKIIWVRDNAEVGLAIDGKTKVLRGSIADISDSKESELKFKAIFNNTFQSVGLLTLDGTLLEANQTALNFVGITRDQVINKPFWETHWFSNCEITQNRLKQSIAQAAQGEFIRYEVDVLNADQKLITIDFSIRPLKDESGQVILLIPEGRDISEFKAMEKALRKGESLLAEAQQVAKIGSWEWNVLADEISWSKEMFNVFGLDPALAIPNYEEHLVFFTPSSQEKLSQKVQEAVNTGKSYHVELELQMPRSDGSHPYVEAIGHAEYDDNGAVIRLYGTSQDISDRKQIESKLIQNKALLNSTIENSPIGIATFDLEGKFLNVNQSLCKIFGYSADELLNMTASDITHPNSIEKTSTALDILIKNEAESVRVEKQYIHKSGHLIDAISLVSLSRAELGNAIQFIANVEDVTERKQTEAKLASAKLAEEANQAKSKFLAVMSHELRTPMNAVIGMTGILLNTPLTPEQQQYVDTIRQGGEMLLEVINDILDFSRFESGRFELEEYPFKLQQCVEEVLDLMTSRTADKSLELLALIDLDVPQQIIGDHTRLRQILVNLVSNAIKFTERGEIVITVKSKLIDQETNLYELLFDVRDTGIGIEPDAIARLFKAFSQADNSISRKYGGTGLGLAICKQLCELMDGEIGVKSTVGKGSTFSFSIRAVAIASEPIAIAPELKGKRILSVNSHPTSQQAIALYTQQWQVSTQIACSATEALQLLELSPFDAVLIDRQLADSDAIELARNIQDSFPDLNLVLVTYLTAIANPSPVSFADCIFKPISASKLSQVFTRIFSSAKNPISPTSNLISNSSLSSNLISPTLDEKFAIDHPLQILVVEDNPVNQQILLLMLEKLGYKSEAVENGLEALNALKRQAYDLIFMDIQMPIMDGLTATQNIRQLSYRHPWIIGLSANASIDSRESALSAGMDDYLTKPLRVKVLIAALRRVPQILISASGQHTLDLATLDTLEDSIGKQDLSKLIIVYLEHSSQAIARMKEAFKNRDLVALEAENHSLKGGSGTFGATQLFELCQDLQFICKILIKSNRHTSEDIEKIESILKNIEAEYNHVAQAFQSYENTEHCTG